MVGCVRHVNLQDPVAWQSAETRMRSEVAGMICQAFDTGSQCVHFGSIVQIVRRHEYRCGPDSAR
ncbi:hypothetical protein Enr13x_04180 [Stieleria neptunia]|uniref:Uncharacterized protein n=1 Tax=Stieleria neptunia TaxID=2527979 RepID=A0A518HIE9_9BACT|nr:hypothetical protein Enr13x_04180 [Stieleria neptunia]